MIPSSWISSVSYLRTPRGDSFLSIFTQDGKALLYGGPGAPIPSWLPGLLSAGLGGRSVGRAYHRLVKGKYPYQRIEGKERVRELRRLMRSGI